MRRLPVLVVVLALAGTPAAHAQDEAEPFGDGPGLSQTPPGAAATQAEEPRGSAAELPATGAEAWLTALAGLGLVLSGVGLRLRLLPDDAR